MLNFLHFTAREYCPLNNKEQDLWCSVELSPILQHPSKGNGTRRLHFYTPPPRVLENSTTPAEDVIIFKDLLPYPESKFVHDLYCNFVTSKKMPSEFYLCKTT